MVLANFALFNAIWVGVVLKTVFFGRLRAIEYEVSGGIASTGVRAGVDRPGLGMERSGDELAGIVGFGQGQE
jgi:hypothetical protein